MDDGTMRHSRDVTRQLKALSNENRLTILEWLLDPTAHFPPQVDGDLVEDGVCLGAIARKLGVSQPTATAHMKTMLDAGLVTSTRIRNWVFFAPKRDEIEALLSELSGRLDRRAP
jgi:ArsR family transcriptional regulator